MLQRLVPICVSAVFATTLALDAHSAGAQNAPASHDPTQTVFVDLTAGTIQAAPPSTPVDSTQTRTVDLTNSTSAPTMVGPVATPPPSRVPKTKVIDLAVPGAESQAYVRTDADYLPINDELVVITADRQFDPYEEDNRGRFSSHVWLHHTIIDPVESLYIGIVPAFVRQGVHNFVTNLEGPTIFVNDVLQVDPDRAGGTFGRFVLNSTFGVGGIFDVASWAGIPYRDDDFGMTLANYGVSDYPYLLIPLVGPSNPRDMTGKVVDIFINPLHYLTIPGGIFTDLGQESMKQADSRSYDVGRLDSIVDNEPDPYATERHDSRESRQSEIDSRGLDSDEGKPVP